MNRLAATTILLGVMVLVFLIPVALLFVSALALILDYAAGGIGAGTGGVDFSFIFSLSRRAVLTSLFIIILLLAALISWLTQKILRRQNRSR
jgi:hypothetical protein